MTRHPEALPSVRCQPPGGRKIQTGKRGAKYKWRGKYTWGRRLFQKYFISLIIPLPVKIWYKWAFLHTANRC
jgi:hypothetical protein